MCVLLYLVFFTMFHICSLVPMKTGCVCHMEQPWENPMGNFTIGFHFVINYAFQFVLLLAMNSVNILKIQKRTTISGRRSGNNGVTAGKGQNSKVKNSEAQIFAILLLVTFGFLILTTPDYLLFLFIMVVDFWTSPKVFAGYYLFYIVAQKLHYTKHGTNFFLNIISGQKFWTDLMKLFVNKDRLTENISFITDNTSTWSDDYPKILSVRLGVSLLAIIWHCDGMQFKVMNI